MQWWNFSPAPDLELWGLIFPHVLFSGGLLFSQTPASLAGKRVSEYRKHEKGTLMERFWWIWGRVLARKGNAFGTLSVNVGLGTESLPILRYPFPGQCVHTYACAHARTHARTNVCTYVRTHVRTYACMNACVHQVRSVLIISIRKTSIEGLESDIQIHMFTYGSIVNPAYFSEHVYMQAII